MHVSDQSALFIDSQKTVFPVDKDFKRRYNIPVIWFEYDISPQVRGRDIGLITTVGFFPLREESGLF